MNNMLGKVTKNNANLIALTFSFNQFNLDGLGQVPLGKTTPGTTILGATTPGTSTLVGCFVSGEIYILYTVWNIIASK